MSKPFAFDLDGVIADPKIAYLGAVRAILGNSDPSALSHEPVGPDCIPKGLSSAEKRLVFNHAFSQPECIPPEPGAIEFLKEYYLSTGCISIISYRVGRVQIDGAVEWLDTYLEGMYHLFVSKPATKVEIVLANNLEGMVEDNPYTARMVSERGRTSILLSKEYNEMVDCPGVVRVADWKEISEVVSRRTA